MSNVFNYGPTGRSYNVDDDGRLMLNADASASGYVFGYGDTGHPMTVDGNGKILVSITDDYRTELINAVDETFEIGANQIKGSGSCIPFKGNIYTSNRGWGALEAENVYKLTSSGGEWTSEKVFTLPSGGYPWAMEAVGDRLYVGGGEGGVSGCVFYTEDGDNWYHLANLPHTPGANQQPLNIMDMCEFNGELVVSIANNLWWGPQPIYRWNEDDGEFKILTYQLAPGGSWGWSWLAGAAGGRLFSTANFNDVLNVYDGSASRYIWKTDHDIGQAIEYNGNTYLIGDKIYRYLDDSEGIKLDIEFELPGGEKINEYGQHEPAIVHNGKLWVAAYGMLICKDNDEWIYVNTAHSGELGRCARMYEHDGTMYAFSWGGYFSFKDNLLSPGVPQHNHSTRGGTQYIKEIAKYIGVLDHQYDDYSNPTYYDNIDGDTRNVFILRGDGLKDLPNFSNSGVLTSDDTLRSAIVKLDNHASSGARKINTVINSWVWASGESLYHQTVNHNLNDRFVAVQYYDTSTYSSDVSGVYHVLTDKDNVEIWNATSGDLGIIIHG